VLDLEVFDRVSLLLVQEPGESCAVIGGKTGAQLAQAAVFRPVVFIVIRTVNRPMLELFPTEGPSRSEIAKSHINDDLAVRPFEQLVPEHVSRHKSEIVVQCLDRAQLRKSMPLDLMMSAAEVFSSMIFHDPGVGDDSL